MLLIRRLFLAFILLGFAHPALAATLSFDTSGDKETITLSVRGAQPHSVFTLANPDRLVVDVASVSGHPDTSLPSGYNGAISNVRSGQFNPKTYRFVFELRQPVRVSKVNESKADDGEIAIDIEPVGKKKAVAAKPDKPEHKDKKQAKKSDKPLIVIDAGHGGVDPGTISASGQYEKDIVLTYARALRDKLKKSGRYEVMMTRDEDEFIMLRKRVDIARKAGADLFISLHADSAGDSDARGLSVYTVSEQASDVEAAALAARENKADVLAGIDLSDERKDVADILISLAERETKNRSATLADLIVTSLDEKITLLPNSHRFAGFAVLKAPDVPSVLVELGFLSHHREEKLIRSKAYRDTLISGLAAGIDAYFKAERL